MNAITMKARIYILVLLTSIIGLSGCNSEDEKTQQDQAAAINVKVSTINSENNNPFITASGKIEAAKNANLSTRMMGYVNKVHVKVGDKVRKGQLLLSINNADLSAKSAQVNAGITEAKAAFNNAEKDYTRFKNLFADNSASQKELDDMAARYEMAKARLEGAQQMKNEVGAQFSYVNIRAPFEGVITNRFIDPGAMASPGMPLIAMESPGDFEVTAAIPENEISQIVSGADVKVMVKSLDTLINGKVSEISSSAKNTGGQYLVKIALDKTEVPILSGMYATVQFPIEEKLETHRVLIPKDVLVNRGQLSGVYTVSQSNTAMLRWLRLGRSFGDQVEVLSGLAADESYIVTADSKLFNGAKITIQ